MVVFDLLFCSCVLQLCFAIAFCSVFCSCVLQLRELPKIVIAQEALTVGKIQEVLTVSKSAGIPNGRKIEMSLLNEFIEEIKSQGLIEAASKRTGVRGVVDQ